MTWEADAVVLVTMRRQRRRPLPDARGGPRGPRRGRHPGPLPDRRLRRAAAHRLGDCLVPRLIADAVFDGHRLAREIDEPDPAVPLPFIRERRTLTWTDADFDRVVTERGIGWPVSSALAERRI